LRGQRIAVKDCVPLEDATVVPELSEEEHEDARQRTSVTAYVVHEAIRLDGEEELRRRSSALAWSGLAAGLSMGFSLVGEGVLRACLPDVPWRPMVAKFGYSLGFLIVILGRQQLFTENTLTAILPLLARRSRSTLWQVLRLWMVVLGANLAGAHLFAWIAGTTSVFQPQVRQAFDDLGREAIDVGFGTAILRGIFAGWLIALVVWLNAAYASGKIAIIVILTYFVGMARLTHIVAGSVEVLVLVMNGGISWQRSMTAYMLPSLLGNIIGGVTLVSALNHAQVIPPRDKG
jgi:formate/nitrite transporter FocA (FNT family)